MLSSDAEGSSRGWGPKGVPGSLLSFQRDVPGDLISQLSSQPKLLFTTNTEPGRCQGTRGRDLEVLVSDRMSVGAGHELHETPHQSTVEHVC